MGKKYSANLTWEPFLWYEMRIVADLIKQWLDRKEIKEKIIITRGCIVNTMGWHLVYSRVTGVH